MTYYHAPKSYNIYRHYCVRQFPGSTLFTGTPAKQTLYVSKGIQITLFHHGKFIIEFEIQHAMGRLWRFTENSIHRVVLLLSGWIVHSMISSSKMNQKSRGCNAHCNFPYPPTKCPYPLWPKYLSKGLLHRTSWYRLTRSLIQFHHAPAPDLPRLPT